MSEPTVTYTEGETIDYAEIVVSQRALDDWRAGCIVPGVESDYEFRVSGGTLAECLALVRGPGEMALGLRATERMIDLTCSSIVVLFSIQTTQHKGQNHETWRSKTGR